MNYKIAHVSPWGVHCGIAKHLSYWLARSARPALICAEIPPWWHTQAENWNTFTSVRCWQRGAPDALAEAARVAWQNDARIVHLQWDPSFFTFRALEEYAAWAKDRGVRTVVTAHTLADEDLFLWENKAILRIADALCVGTPAMVEAFAAFARRFGIAMKRAPRWVPLSAPDISPTAAVKADGGPVILTWGFLGAIKGHLEVLRAVRALRQYAPGARYVVMGRAITGEQMNTLAALRERAAAEPDLFEVREGFLSDAEVLGYCAWAHCIVLNHQCRNASSSGTVVLSVASGTPVVVSDSPMFSGYVEAGAVRVAAPGVDGLADAILDVLTDGRDLARGRAEMLKRTGAEAVAAEYESIYGELEQA